MDSRGAREPDEGVKSLRKAVQILGCFSPTDRTLSLGEICRRTDFPKSTVHRLLSSLRDVGFLEQDDDRDRYRLGLRLFEFGNLVLANMELHREARPMVEALSRVSGHAVHLAVFDGRRAIVIHRVEPTLEASPSLTFMESAPAHCSSVGKAILAFQDEATIERVIALGLERYTDNTIVEPDQLRRELAAIRARGYATDNAEHRPGLRCIGAPIRDHMGRVFASISIFGPSWRLPVSEFEDLAKIVIHDADAISRSLGYRPEAALPGRPTTARHRPAAQPEERRPGDP